MSTRHLRLGVLVLILLVLQAGCASWTPRGGLLARSPSPALIPPAAPRARVTLTVSTNFAPARLSEWEFREALSRLLLEVPLELRPRAALPLGGGRRVVLASAWRPPDASIQTDVERGYFRFCERNGTPGDCLLLLQDAPLLTSRDRFHLAFALAIRPALEAAAETLQAFSPHLMTVVAGALVVTVLLMVAPEPVTKVLGAGMVLFFWGFLGHELWGLLEASFRLVEESRDATTFNEVREASERFGRAVGPNTVRVLILLATKKLGTKGQQAMKGDGLPGIGQVRGMAAANGIDLEVAAAEAEAAAVAEGRLTLTLPAGSGAVLAVQKQGEDEEGHLHHICTNKNGVAAVRGGPWTPRCLKLFEKAGMDLEDEANKVLIKGHKGPHPEEYHQQIYNRLVDAMKGCRGLSQCRDALTGELGRLARELNTPGTPLNKLVTRSH